MAAKKATKKKTKKKVERAWCYPQPRKFSSGKLVPKELYSMYDAMIKHGAKMGGAHQCIIQKHDNTYVSVYWAHNLECICKDLGLKFIGGIRFIG